MMADLDQILTTPMASYITKLMILEAIKCTQTQDESGLAWIQRTLHHLAIRWEELSRKPR